MNLLDFEDNNDDLDEDDDLKQTPFILQWSIRFLGGSDEPQRARTITFTTMLIDHQFYDDRS